MVSLRTSGTLGFLYSAASASHAIKLDAERIKEALNDGDEHGTDSTLLFEVAHAVLNSAGDRAEIHGVEVDEVTIDPSYPNQVHIEFTTSWSLYVGCRDMNSAGEEPESETATYTADGNLVFVVPALRRPANHC
ncbi:hypothetical protein [Massilia eurypsychrophila]|uniref:hypothetical protein n=1 Tax=Massilia eurypsychrophila TaxID=1485217 RepID=UPI0015D4C672|nr:hypothetical protein [Massilia eurypsychrophila]